MQKTTNHRTISFLLVISLLLSFIPLASTRSAHAETSFQSDIINADITLSGTVYDAGIEGGQKHGYPLHAKITLEDPENTYVFYTDPWLGRYTIQIESGVEYTLSIEPQLFGYVPASETFTADADLVKDYNLHIENTCTAAGYGLAYAGYFDFDESDEGFTFGGTNSSWAWGDFESGPGHAISGTKGIATNPTGDYNNSEQSFAMSPIIDLSGVGLNDTAFIEWWNWLYTESATSLWDVGSVQFTKDGGATWDTVWGPTPRHDSAYRKEAIVIENDYHVVDFQFRFWFKSDSSGVRPGWYIDNIGLSWVELDPNPIPLYSYTFDDEAEEQWTTGSSGSGANSWQKGVPTTGPAGAYSEPNVWATNLDGNYNANEISYITSPVMDLSAYPDHQIIISYQDWLMTESPQNWADHGRVYASKDGGETWVEIRKNIVRKDPIGSGYTAQSFILEPGFISDSFQWRFEYRSDRTVHQLGWYIDNVKVEVREWVTVPCGPISGGVVAGYVYDLNETEDVKVFDALVETASANDRTILRPNDPDHDGMYYFFQAFEESDADVAFTVSKEQYGTINESRTLIPDTVNRQDFRIGSGWIETIQSSLERTIVLGDDDEFSTLDLRNRGAGYANWTLLEVDKGFTPSKVSIPAFRAELPALTEPVSIEPAPKSHSQENQVRMEGMPQTPHIALLENTQAVGINLLSDRFVAWDDITSPQNLTELGITRPKLQAGDFLGENYKTLYTISYENNIMYAVDTSNGAYREIAQTTPPLGTKFTGLTGADGFFYGVSAICDEKSELSRVDLDGTVTHIGNIPTATCLVDIAYVPDQHMIYGVDLITSALHRIDPETAQSEFVGSLGIRPNYAQGMDYDEVNGIMYWAAYTTYGSLRVIDLETGASSHIGNFPESTEIDSFAIKAYGEAIGEDVPWLDEEPKAGFLDGGESTSLNIRFTVKDVIEQPGDCFAELHFKTDTSKEVAPVPVTMHVLRPHDWGTIKGTLTASEKCDINPAALANAEVKFYQNDVFYQSTTTDENGFYHWALPRGRYSVEVEHPGYVSYRMDDVELGMSQDLDLDINLRHDSACLVIDPSNLYAEQMANQVTVQTLSFTNTGAADAVIKVEEYPGEGPVPFSGDPVELVLDDGTAEEGIGIGGTHQFIWLNRFTPDAESFPFNLESVQIYFDSLGGVLNGHSFEIYVYENTSGNEDPAVGSKLLYSERVTANTLDTFHEFVLAEPVLLEGPGDVIIGVGALVLNPSGYWPAALDMDSSLQRSWIGWWSTPLPADPVLPPDESWSLVDVFKPGNWLLRAYGTTSQGGDVPGDIVWLSLDPNEFLVGKDGGKAEIVAEFDSKELTSGDYFGRLGFNNQNKDKLSMPVQLRVLGMQHIYLPLIQTEASE